MQQRLIMSNRLFGSSGPLVVLVPSLGRGAADFDALGAAVGGAGFRALACDPRGIGKTSAAPGDQLTLHDYAGDIATLIELRGEGPVHIIGHAWGNRVVRTLASDRPELVRSVTLLACGGQVGPEADIAALFPRCFELDLPWAERREAVAACFFAPGHDPKVWREGWHPAASAEERKAVTATPNAEYRAAGTAPLLIIQGLQDRLAPPANGRVLKEELGDRVRLVDLDGCGHAMLPEQPDRIAAEVVAFLKPQ
jgi:pimeloyl-ACP methyl ester carboxylesterase